eukprot:UN12836
MRLVRTLLNLFVVFEHFSYRQKSRFVSRKPLHVEKLNLFLFGFQQKNVNVVISKDD